jgi:hypothetical protein
MSDLERVLRELARLTRRLRQGSSAADIPETGRAAVPAEPEPTPDRPPPQQRRPELGST